MLGCIYKFNMSGIKSNTIESKCFFVVFHTKTSVKRDCPFSMAGNFELAIIAKTPKQELAMFC